MKLAIFSFLLVGAAVAAPAEPAWKFARGDNDTNATVPSTRMMNRSGHARLPVWKRFQNTTSTPHVARNENRTGMTMKPLSPLDNRII